MTRGRLAAVSRWDDRHHFLSCAWPWQEELYNAGVSALRAAEGDDDLDDEDNDNDLAGAWDTGRRKEAFLLYGLERLCWYIQSVAVMLTVPVAWPPTVAYYGLYIRHWLDFPAWWLLAAAQHSGLSVISFNQDLIKYGLAVMLPALLLVFLFHFWTIPDYTDSAVTRYQLPPTHPPQPVPARTDTVCCCCSTSPDTSALAACCRRWFEKYIMRWWDLCCGTFVQSLLAMATAGVGLMLANKLLIK